MTDDFSYLYIYAMSPFNIERQLKKNAFIFTLEMLKMAVSFNFVNFVNFVDFVRTIFDI